MNHKIGLYGAGFGGRRRSLRDPHGEEFDGGMDKHGAADGAANAPSCAYF